MQRGHFVQHGNDLSPFYGEHCSNWWVLFFPFRSGKKKEAAQGVLNRGNLFLKIQACYWIISSAHQGLMTKRYYLAIRGSHELWLVTDHLISHALAI